MGKKKSVNNSNPDALKAAGNKAFDQKKYEEAVK
jgi:tetratricopeptide (TPR) repeat protein